MVQQNVRESGQGQKVFSRSVQSCREGGKGIIGRGKHRKGAFTGEGAREVCFDHGSLQNVVHLAVDDDVYHGGGLRFGGRKQYRIDDVNHTVVGDDVRDGDLGVVDEDATIVDGDGHVFSQERSGSGTVGEVGRQDLSAHHVVQQNVRESGQGQKVFSRSVQSGGQRKESIIGRGKHRKGAFAGEGAREVCFDHRCFKEIVHCAVDDDVDNGGGFTLFNNDGADHAFMFSIVAHSIFKMIDTGFVKCDRAQAIVEEPPGVIGGQVEGHRIVKVFTSVTGFSIDAVPSAVVGEGYRFSDLYSQFRGLDLVIVDGDVVVPIALGCCGQAAGEQRQEGNEITH